MLRIYNPKEGDGGWGCIVGFRWRCDDRDTLEDEVIACLQGAQAAIDVGIGHVAETDAPMATPHGQFILMNSIRVQFIPTVTWELKNLQVDNFLKFRVQIEAVIGLFGRYQHWVRVGDDPILDIIPPCIQILVAGDLPVVE
jgi:hypothetical protein